MRRGSPFLLVEVVSCCPISMTRAEMSSCWLGSPHRSSTPPIGTNWRHRGRFRILHISSVARPSTSRSTEANLCCVGTRSRQCSMVSRISASWSWRARGLGGRCQLPSVVNRFSTTSRWRPFADPASLRGVSQQSSCGLVTARLAVGTQADGVHPASLTHLKPTVPERSRLGAIKRYFPCWSRRYVWGKYQRDP